MSNGMPELGSKISLISKADIRYEGKLFTVDAQGCTLALSSVRSFGTEDRDTPYKIAPQNQIYEYILFRGTDIKDIRVVNNILPHATDPAILEAQLSPDQEHLMPHIPMGNMHGAHGMSSADAFGDPGAAAAPSLAPDFALPAFRPFTLVPGNQQQEQQQQQQQQAPQQNQPDSSRPTTPKCCQSASEDRPEHNQNAGLNRQNHRPQPQQHQGGSRNASTDYYYQQPPRRMNNFNQYHDERRNNYNDQRNQTQNRRWTVHREPNNMNMNNNNNMMRNRDGGERGRMPNQGYRAIRGIGGNQNKPRNNKNKTIKFEEDFDFEQGNNKFEELRTQLSKLKVSDDKPKTETDKKDDSGNETGAGEHEHEANEEIAVGYDKKKSFFDNISCEATEYRNKKNKNNWREERKLNSETFGVTARRHRGSYRGRTNYYNNRNMNNYMGGGGGGGAGGSSYPGGNNYRNRSNNRMGASNVGKRDSTTFNGTGTGNNNADAANATGTLTTAATAAVQQQQANADGSDIPTAASAK